MPARTFTYGGVNNLYSNILNWDVFPIAGDTATIAGGSSCTYDIATGAQVDLAGLTVNGTLNASTTAGSYTIQCSGPFVIGATGTVNVGTSLTVPYPATCTWIVDFDSTASGITVTAGGQLNMFCVEPTHKYITLSLGEAANATVYRTGTDITADANPWYAGDTVYICNVNKAQEYSVRTIAAGGIAAGAITMNAGTSGATIAGSYLVNVTRNIRVLGTTTGVNIITLPATGIVGGNISASITGTTASYGVGGGTSYWTVGGAVYGVAICFNTCSGITSSGSTTGNNYGFGFCSGVVVSNATFTGNTSDLRVITEAQLYNCALGATVENYQYNTSNVPLWSYVESFDHDQVAGAFKSWTRGGVTVSDTTPANLPTGYAVSYKHTCEDATCQNFRQLGLSISPGATLKVNGQIRIADDHTAWAPRLEIIACSADPLWGTGAAALATSSVATPGGSAQWQPVSCTYTNSTSRSKDVYVRMSAKRAAGDVYEVLAFDEWPAASGGITTNGLTVTVPGREHGVSAWTKNATSTDLSGCEQLVAAPGVGYRLVIEKLTVQIGSNVTVTFGEGETAGAVTTTLLGPLGGDPGSYALDFRKNPIMLTANTSLTVDADCAGAVCILVEGYTREDV
jgi:hypothetical protein